MHFHVCPLRAHSPALIRISCAFSLASCLMNSTIYARISMRYAFPTKYTSTYIAITGTHVVSVHIHRCIGSLYQSHRMQENWTAQAFCSACYVHVRDATSLHMHELVKTPSETFHSSIPSHIPHPCASPATDIFTVTLCPLELPQRKVLSDSAHLSQEHTLQEHTLPIVSGSVERLDGTGLGARTCLICLFTAC